MATPERLTKVCAKNPSNLPATIPGLERLLSHNREAKIVWQHIGWDNTGFLTAKLLSGLLAKHPNLYLSIRIPDPSNRDFEVSTPNPVANTAGIPNPEWSELIQAFPDRFVIGGDEFISGSSSGSKKPKSFDTTWAFVRHLPKKLARKLSRSNPKAIYNL